MSQFSTHSQNLPNLLTRNLSIGDNSENEMITDENQPPTSQNMSTSKSKPKKRKKKKTTQVTFPEDMNRDILGIRGEMKDGGTLKEVRLVDFMSHKNFVFPGKNEKLKAISFICGPNGSGKSAILMAMRLQSEMTTNRQSEVSVI